MWRVHRVALLTETSTVTKYRSVRDTAMTCVMCDKRFVTYVLTLAAIIRWLYK